MTEESNDLDKTVGYEEPEIEEKTVDPNDEQEAELNNAE